MTYIEANCAVMVDDKGTGAEYPYDEGHAVSVDFQRWVQCQMATRRS